MHRLDIPAKKIHVEYPSKLQECSPEQAAFFVGLYLKYLQKQISVEDMKVMMAKNFLKLKSSAKYWSALRRSKNDKASEDYLDTIRDNIYQIAYSLNSFFVEEDNEGRKTLKPEFTCIKNIIPKIKGFYGPADALTDCTFYEYKEAHTAFMKFVNTENDVYLHRLAAILYRPKKLFLFIRKRLPKFNGRIRKEIRPDSNSLILENRINKMSRLSHEQLYYIFLFYRSCEEYLFNGTPEIDGKEINLSVLYEGTGSSTGDDIGLTGVLFSLAESNVFGDIDKTANTGLYDILVRLYQMAVQFKKFKKDNDTNKNI